MALWLSDDLDLEDNISRMQSQLEALLMSLYGDGGVSFHGMNDRFKDNLLWLASDLSVELGKATRQYFNEQRSHTPEK